MSDKKTDDGWVSVDDRLPDNEDNVLICNTEYLKSADAEHMEVAYCIYGEWTSFISTETPQVKPTHWHKLPAPPK
jgi:hypothetical protein